MEEILNSTHFSFLYKSTVKEHENEKEGFILIHGHHNGPIN